MTYQVKIMYHVAGFNGEMYSIEEIEAQDLPQMFEFWKNACPNVKGWEVLWQS